MTLTRDQRKDPYNVPGGAVWTRIQRPHTVHGPTPRWQADSHDEYLAASGMSASALKVLASKTPAHFRAWLLEEREATSAQAFGTLVHDFILLEQKVIQAPKLNMRTNDGKAEFAALQAEAMRQGAVLVTEEECAALHSIRDSVNSLPEVCHVLSSSLTHREVSGYVTLDSCAAKIRPDIRDTRTGIIWDLKTCADASPEGFQRDAWKFGYHIQAAWYLSVANVIEPSKYHSFRFIAVENKAPYAVAIYEASSAFLEAGATAVSRALEAFEECLQNKRWPGFSDEVRELDPPAWILKKQSQGDFE